MSHTLLTVLELLLLSAVSLGFVSHLLNKPYRPEHVLMAVPSVTSDIPDTTLDWIGLV